MQIPWSLFEENDVYALLWSLFENNEVFMYFRGHSLKRMKSLCIFVVTL